MQFPNSIYRLAGLVVVLASLDGAFQPLFATESLDRGAVVVSQPDGSVFLSWRLLAEDPPDAAFDIFRAEAPGAPAAKVNPRPIREGCNFVDATAGGKAWAYSVRRTSTKSDPHAERWATAATAGGFVRIRLQGPYRAQKVGLGDFDGDGRLDYLVKQPNFNTDPYQQPGYWKRSEDTYKLEAYRHDGSFLWRYDMGWAIEEGVWYSPIVVCDLDGNGRAEVYCKAGEGDPREPTGHVRTGPEYLVKLDGRTGQEVRRLPWPSREGFEDYNRWSRNLLGIAWLDGRRPHLVVVRGTYSIIKVQIYDPDLDPVWYWEASGEHAKHRGQGMHGLHAADLDGDGRDEIVLGSSVLDDNGQPLWSTFKGHPDVCYVADVDPELPGLEVFYGLETRQRSNAVCLVEGRTGRVLWGCPEPTVHVHSQGMVGDIIAEHPGMELYAGEAKGGTNYWLYTARGRRLSDQSLGELSPKAVYWLDGPTKTYIVGRTMYRWPREQVARFEGNIVAIADCLGDWREEVIAALDGEIRIYTTTVPTPRRRVCLLQDRLYRNDVAVQTMGYFYPPQLGRALFPPH